MTDPKQPPEPHPPSHPPQNTTSSTSTSTILTTYIHQTTNLPDLIVRAEVGAKTVQDQISKTLKTVALFEVEFAL